MIPKVPDAHIELARRAGDRLAELPGVDAVALGGSVATGTADSSSNIDLYVFAPEPPLSDLRRALAVSFDPMPEINNRAFGTEDAFTDAGTGINVDVVFWSLDWIDAQLDRVINQHIASTGYTTCFWRTIRQAITIHDEHGALANLQVRASAPYPAPLRDNIVALNRPLLSGARSSFLHQIESAIERNDSMAVNHRLTAWLASYVDILFAINGVLHPGEKRLLEVASRECPLLPGDMSRDISSALAAAAPPVARQRLLDALQRLISGLDPFLSFRESHAR